MKIGTRIFLSLVIPMVAVIAIFAYLEEQHGRALLREELASEGRAVARTAQIALEDAIRDGQDGDIRDLVDQITGYERVLGARIFDRSGSIVYQSADLELHPFIHHEALRRALDENTLVETRRLIGNDPVVTFIMPLSGPDDQPAGAVQVIQLESFIEEDARASRNFTFALTVAVILATGAIVLVVTRLTVSRPVDVLVRRFREVGSGDLRARVRIRHTGELGRMAQEFNRMCERLEESQRSLLEEHERRLRVEGQMRKVEHLASVGRLAAGLAHEIGTPLGVIAGRAESLQRKLSDHDAAARGLAIIGAQIERIDRIVRGVLDFARAGEPRFASTDVAAVLRKVLEFLEHRFLERGIRLEAALCDLPPTLADADQLHQVFLNLALNAVDAMPDGGVLRVQCDVVERSHELEPGATGAFQRVVVEDTGGGIAPQDLDRVFEPFFTTKEVGRGTGLGLSVSYGIVRDHGGWIHVESHVGQGTRFTVYLPTSPRAAPTLAEDRA